MTKCGGAIVCVATVLVGNRYVVWFYIISFFAWLIVRNILHI